MWSGAIGVAAVSAKYFGVDSSIIGLMIGAFGVSTGLWAGKWLKKEYFAHQGKALVFASFALTVIPLSSLNTGEIYVPVMLLGEPGSLLNRVYWFDKLLLGALLGGVTSLAAYWLHLRVKSLHGKVIVPFQGVVFTLALLALASAALFLAFR